MRAGNARGIALLFDLDGTLVDTDRLHHEAFNAVLAGAGRPQIGFEDYKERLMGRPNAEIGPILFPGPPDRAAALCDDKERVFRERLGGAVDPLPGATDLLDWAEGSGVAVAVVTNAPRMNAEVMLRAAGLADRFATVVIGDECARPKPDPAPYREAMRRLGALPSRSIAFEDSRSGLRAARGSGAFAFGITTGLGADELLLAGAHRAIPDFTHPALWAHLTELEARVA